MYHKFVKENVLNKIKQYSFRSRYEYNNKGECIVRWCLILSFQTFNSMYFISLTTHIILVCNVKLNKRFINVIWHVKLTQGHNKRKRSGKNHTSRTLLAVCMSAPSESRHCADTPPQGCNNTSKLEYGLDYD